MVVIGVIVCVLLGFSVVERLRVRLSKIELLGLSFLVGLAVQTMLMLIIDAMGIDLSAATTLTTATIAILALNGCNIVKRKNPFARFCMRSEWLVNFKVLNLVWLMAVGFICYVEYMNFAKTMYVPPFDRDSLAGFETIGYVIGMEGRLQGLSLFDAVYMPSIHNAGSYITYAPMVQLSYGWVYMLGAETSKIIAALVFLSFLMVLYGAVRRVSSDMTGALVTALVLVSPEMLAFASLSTTNVINAVYASLGVIYVLQWFKSRDRGELLLGSVLLACNVWVRSEGVVFLMAVGLLMLIDAVRRRQWRGLTTMVLISVSPMVVWWVFCAFFGLTSESVTILHPYWDGEKASKITRYVWQLIVHTGFYGWSFYVAGAGLVLSLPWIFRRNGKWLTLVVIVVGLLFYCLLLYQINYTWDTIDNVLSYSAKRFMFCFIPLLWYFAATCPAGHYLLARLNGWLGEDGFYQSHT